MKSPSLTFVSAVFDPRTPAGFRLAPHAIPWVGSRHTWLAIRHPTPWDPDQLAYLLLGGSDGHALMEGGPLYAPQVVAARCDLEGMRLMGQGGAKP